MLMLLIEFCFSDLSSVFYSLFINSSLLGAHSSWSNSTHAPFSECHNSEAYFCDIRSLFRIQFPKSCFPNPISQMNPSPIALFPESMFLRYSFSLLNNSKSRCAHASNQYIAKFKTKDFNKPTMILKIVNSKCVHIQLQL